MPKKDLNQIAKSIIDRATADKDVNKNQEKDKPSTTKPNPKNKKSV